MEQNIIKVNRSIKNSGSIISQDKGLLDFLAPLTKVDQPLMKNVFTSLAKDVLVPLRLTAAASATDPTIQKNVFGSGMSTLIITSQK